MNKNDLNKIFVNTKIRNDNGKSITIPNTAQNLYLNNNLVSVSKKKQLKSIKQETYNQIENDSEESDSDNTEESDSDENDIEKNNDDEIVDPNIEQIKTNKNESDNESESETETETETISESETDTDIVVSEVVETEYNEDDKDTEKKNDDENEDCMYEYDDIIDDKDSDKKTYQTPQNERITDNQMTHYEKIRILGIRSKQIAMGAKVMVKYNQNMSSKYVKIIN